MSKKETISEFYDVFKNVHCKYFPNLREGQFAMNFWSWVSYEKNIDPFYVSHNDAMEYLQEYVVSNCPYNYSCELLERYNDDNKISK